ncbi:MAG TPA: acyltransferase family protein [candidate division Zixibacteria bacterium]|nr:acyltransferase family protein [candidate division Zixibacteria bacterium]
MAQVGQQVTIKPPDIASESTRSSRLFFVDHLRAALIILVVLHHVALVYGASVQGYYYVEPPFTDPAAFRDLLVFALVNQAWFMGAFFLLAGYFAPGSIDRKGTGSFLKDRLIRLGIPLIVFYFVLGPVSFIGYYLMPSTLTGITTPLTWEVFWQAYPDFLGMGPTWFIAMLLIFSFGYAGWRWLIRKQTSSMMSKSSVPSYLGIVIFIVALALLSYLFRKIVPLGEAVSEFPTLAYLPQYLGFFAVGIFAYRRDWFRTLPNSMGVVGFVAAVVATVLLFPLAFSGQWFSIELTDVMSNSMGDLHWQSAVYALWDSIFAVGMCLAAIAFFRRFLNRESKLGTFLSQQSYAVFIIHIPIIVFLAYALRGIVVDSLLKFGLASVIVVPVCFAVAYVLRKIPGVSRVL